MATYLELANIKTQSGYGDFVKKITTAITVKAYTISQEATPTDAMIAWAKEALTTPNEKRKQIEHYVISANKSLAIASILGASDNSIQNNVNDSVDNILAK